MDTFRSLWEWVAENLLPHWPFLLGWIIFTALGQFFKAQVWTKTNAKKNRFVSIMRRTMGLHPMAIGMLFSLIPSVPVSPGVEGWGARMLYWASVGIFASFGFNIVKQWVKKRYDLDIEQAIKDAVNPSMAPAASAVAEEVASRALEEGHVRIVPSVPPANPNDVETDPDLSDEL